jgi:hypothetical protein
MRDLISCAESPIDSLDWTTPNGHGYLICTVNARSTAHDPPLIPGVRDGDDRGATAAPWSSICEFDAQATNTPLTEWKTEGRARQFILGDLLEVEALARLVDGDPWVWGGAPVRREILSTTAVDFRAWPPRSRDLSAWANVPGMHPTGARQQSALPTEVYRFKRRKGRLRESPGDEAGIAQIDTGDGLLTPRRPPATRTCTPNVRGGMEPWRLHHFLSLPSAATNEEIPARCYSSRNRARERWRPGA